MADECQGCGLKDGHSKDCPIKRSYNRKHPKPKERKISIDLTFVHAKALLKPPNSPGHNWQQYDNAQMALKHAIREALATGCKHEWGDDRRCKHCGARIAYD